MINYIAIKRPKDFSFIVTLVRHKIDSASDDPLTEHEQIIGELVEQRDKLAKGLCSLYNDITDAEANHSFLTAEYMLAKINQILKSARP